MGINPSNSSTSKTLPSHNQFLLALTPQTPFKNTRPRIACPKTGREELRKVLTCCCVRCCLLGMYLPRTYIRQLPTQKKSVWLLAKMCEIEFLLLLCLIFASGGPKKISGVILPYCKIANFPYIRLLAEGKNEYTAYLFVRIQDMGSSNPEGRILKVWEIFPRVRAYGITRSLRDHLRKRRRRHTFPSLINPARNSQ